MTEQEFTDEFGITMDEAEKIVAAMALSNQQDWDELVDRCFNLINPTPKYFMKYHAKRMKTMQMLERLGYAIH